MRGEPLDAATLGWHGLDGDRCLALGLPSTARRLRLRWSAGPQLLLVSVRVFVAYFGSSVVAASTRASHADAREAFTWAGAGPLWTRDGRHIITAATSADTRGPNSSLIQVDTATGAQSPLGSRTFTEVGRLAWLSDDSLVVAASERLGANQLWRVSYPDGAATRITNDEARNYLGVSVTANGDVVSVERDPQASIRVAEEGDARRIRQVTPGKYDGRYGLAWTPDGRIVYHSLESGNDDIWIMNADGGDRRQLTVDGGLDDRPSVLRTAAMSCSRRTGQAASASGAWTSPGLARARSPAGTTMRARL